jgi:hypothetical protein
MSLCHAYLIGSSVARGVGSRDTGDCSHGAGEMREGWAQRVVQAMSAVYGISMEEYTSDGTNTGLWLDPDEDENEKPFGTWNTEQRNTVRGFYGNINASSTPGLFVLIGLSPSNEGMAGAVSETDPAYKARIGTPSQVVGVYNAGIQRLVSRFSSYGMPTIVSGNYPGEDFDSAQTNGTWFVNDRMSSGSTSPNVSTSQGTYISFLRGDWPTHRCEAELRAGTVEATDANCGQLQSKYNRFCKETATRGVRAGGGVACDVHPNVYGHIAMYRNLDVSVFEAVSVKGGCTTATPPYVYEAVGSGGECTLPAGQVELEVHLGDRLAVDSAFSARQDMCEALCSANPRCFGYDFMTNASLGRQWRQCDDDACETHSCNSTGRSTGTDEEPPMERRCRLVVSTRPWSGELEANLLDQSESAAAYAGEYACYRRGLAEPPSPPRSPPAPCAPPPSTPPESASPPTMVAIVLSMTASGSVSDYLDTSSLQTAIANLAGVDVSRVTILVTADRGVLITATIAVTVFTVSSVTMSLSSSLSSITAASTALGIAVETLPSILVAAPPPPPPPPVLDSDSDSSLSTAFVLVVVFAVLLCALVASIAWYRWLGGPRREKANSAVRTVGAKAEA